MSFGSFDNDASPRLSADINTTPLVDVMLVLLVVFILTAPLLTQGIKVKLPQANGNPLMERELPVNLSIQKDGTIHLNDTLVSPSHFESALIEITHRQPQPEIRIHADQETPYLHVAKVLSTAQQVGLTQIGFVTLTETQALKNSSD